MPLIAALEPVSCVIRRAGFRLPHQARSWQAGACPTVALSRDPSGSVERGYAHLHEKRRAEAPLPAARREADEKKIVA